MKAKGPLLSILKHPKKATRVPIQQLQFQNVALLSLSECHFQPFRAPSNIRDSSRSFCYVTNNQVAPRCLLLQPLKTYGAFKSLEIVPTKEKTLKLKKMNHPNISVTTTKPRVTKPSCFGAKTTRHTSLVPLSPSQTSFYSRSSTSFAAAASFLLVHRFRPHRNVLFGFSTPFFACLVSSTLFTHKNAK